MEAPTKYMYTEVRNRLREYQASYSWKMIFSLVRPDWYKFSTILVPTDRAMYEFLDSIPAYLEARTVSERFIGNNPQGTDGNAQTLAFANLVVSDLNLADITYNHYVKVEPKPDDKFIRLYNGREYPASSDDVAKLKIVGRLNIQGTNIVVIDRVLVFDDQKEKLGKVLPVKLFAIIRSDDHVPFGFGPLLVEAPSIDVVYSSILESLKRIVTDPGTMTPLRKYFYDTIYIIWEDVHIHEITNQDILDMNVDQLMDLMNRSTDTDHDQPPEGGYFSFFVTEVSSSSVLKF